MNNQAPETAPNDNIGNRPTAHRGAAGDERPIVLRVTHAGRLVFSSTRNWLHPLLDLERFAVENAVDLTQCDLADRIIGRAAAFLVVNMGIQFVHADLLSERAIPVFAAHGVRFTYGTVVDRIDCRTEDLLAAVDDVPTAVALIKARAAAAAGTTARTTAATAATAAPPGATNTDSSAQITLRAVSVRRGPLLVLNAVDLAVAAGDRVLITGANGAGKSTLLKSVLGLVPLSGGSIALHGLDRHQIGYVNQESVQVDFPISAAEVVAIGVSALHLRRDEKRRRVADAMDRTQCRGLAGRAYGELSGGEKQRVAIARCLCQQPRVLLLDEPTASLDVRGKREFVALLEQLRQTDSMTMVMVSHEADGIAGFDPHAWRLLTVGGGRLTPAVVRSTARVGTAS